jgi:putative ABC transport system ATP-binding protein
MDLKSKMKQTISRNPRIILDNEEAEVIIETRHLFREFQTGDTTVHALQDVNLKVYTQDFIVIFGPSGCGKSTLLNLILGIDEPTKGEVLINGLNIFKLEEDNRANFRSRKIGMIYQMPYWVKSLNILENVALPLIAEGIKTDHALQRAKEILEGLNLYKFALQPPNQLSGGEQQKMELARSLVTDPWIIMADEPTGNLDSTSGKEIIDLLHSMNEKQGKTIILVTHNEEYWSSGNRRIEMKDGQIIKDTNHG